MFIYYSTFNLIFSSDMKVFFLSVYTEDLKLYLSILVYPVTMTIRTRECMLLKSYFKLNIDMNDTIINKLKS